MKILLAVFILCGVYAYALLQTTNIVIGQTESLNNTYQYVSNNSEKIILGE
jgi:hypothetical protein